MRDFFWIWPATVLLRKTMPDSIIPTTHTTILLFTPDMKIYTDSRVSDFLRKMKPEQSVGFLNSWNQSRNKRQRIYISYDSTNKNCQAGDIDLVEYGKAKVDEGLPVFNYSVACDASNREPHFFMKCIREVSMMFPS